MNFLRSTSDLAHVACISGPLNVGSPCWIFAQGARISDDHQTTSCSCDHHIEPPPIGQEAHTAARVAADRAE